MPHENQPWIKQNGLEQVPHEKPAIVGRPLLQPRIPFLPIFESSRSFKRDQHVEVANALLAKGDKGLVIGRIVPKR
jgi:hypothetical protein